MKGKIKAIGLAAMALLAMGAVMATGAQGATFTASSYPANVTGEQKTVIVGTVQGQKTECTKAHFQGSLTAATHELTLTPTFTGCKSFGFSEALITMNGCDFQFTIASSTPTTNSMHIRCPAGASITKESPPVNPSCIIHIPEQTPTTNVIDYANSEGGVLVTFTVSGIHSSITKNNFLCPLSASTTDSTGSITGSILLKGLGGNTFDIG